MTSCDEDKLISNLVDDNYYKDIHGWPKDIQGTFFNWINLVDYKIIK